MWLEFTVSDSVAVVVQCNIIYHSLYFSQLGSMYFISYVHDCVI